MQDEAEREKVIGQFLERANPNLKRGCPAVLSCIYWKCDAGWLALATDIMLDPTAANLAPPEGGRIVDLCGLRALRVSVPSEQIPALLRAIGTGRIGAPFLPHDCDDEIKVVANKQGEPFHFQSVRFFERDGLPRYVMESFGENNTQWLTSDIREEIDRRLPALPVPYDGLSGLARDLGMRMTLDWSSNIGFHVTSPYWVWLGYVGPRIAEGILTIEVQSAWRDIGKDVSVSLMPLRDEFAHLKKHIPVGGDGWNVESTEGFRSFTAAIEMQEWSGPCKIALNCDGRKISELITGLGSGRVVAHELTDPDCEVLLKRIEAGTVKKAAQFEEGVTWLLHVCGLATVHYGSQDLQHAPDVVAFLTDEHVIYGECTVTLPDADKLKKVQSRAEEFRSRLASRTGRQGRLVRAVFLPKDRADIPDEVIEDAYEDSAVVIVCLNDLKELLEGARRGESSSWVFHQIAGLGRRFRSVRC